MKTTTLVLLLFLSFAGCIMDYYDHRLYVVNKASVKISVDIVNDTTEKIENNIEYYQSAAIAPNDTSVKAKPGKSSWQEYLEESPTKTLYVYIYNVDTLNKYQSSGNMYYLRTNKKYIECLSYSANELEHANWGIVFK